MVRIHEGQLIAEGYRFCIIASRFNRIFTQQLVDGALDCLSRHGANTDDIDVYWVPGTFEIPSLANRIADANQHSVIICLGTLIRGDTDHYEHLATQVNRGISEISIRSGIPLANGILTCDTMEQAQARSSAKSGNKGWEAALSGIEMANLFGTMNGK